MKHSEFKYLTVSDDDQQWGLYLKVAGSAKVSAGYNYPSQEHPSEYFFNWEEGRILNEFQINFISEGSGILENSFGTFPLKQGSIFITFPGSGTGTNPISKPAGQKITLVLMANLAAN